LRADVAELSSGMKVIENELAELDKNPFQDVRGCIQFSFQLEPQLTRDVMGAFQRL
jgi:hypothetical protein